MHSSSATWHNLRPLLAREKAQAIRVPHGNANASLPSSRAGLGGPTENSAQSARSEPILLRRYAYWRNVRLLEHQNIRPIEELGILRDGAPACPIDCLEYEVACSALSRTCFPTPGLASRADLMHGLRPLKGNKHGRLPSPPCSRLVVPSNPTSDRGGMTAPHGGEKSAPPCRGVGGWYVQAGSARSTPVGCHQILCGASHEPPRVHFIWLVPDHWGCLPRAPLRSR